VNKVVCEMEKKQVQGREWEKIKGGGERKIREGGLIRGRKNLFHEAEGDRCP